MSTNQRTSIELSYYPLNDNYVDAIKGFIDRLNAYEDLVVQTNGMSTQVFGEYDYLMRIMTKEIKIAFDLDHSVFVMKIVNADLQKQ